MGDVIQLRKNGFTVGDIVESIGGNLIGKIIRMWKNGCVVDFQYEDNEDGSPCFGWDDVEFHEIESIPDSGLAKHLREVRSREKRIQSLWPMYNDGMHAIIESRYKAFEEESGANTIAKLDKIIEILSAMYQKSIQQKE